MTTLRGSTSDFPLESVIGLLAGTSKTGELQVRSGSQVGALGFAGGRLVAAVMDSEDGENALGAIFGIHDAEFEFTPWASAPDANLEAGDLVSLLKRAAESRDRLASIREQIPSDSLRFRLSEKAADQGGVTFTPDRWRALLAVNGERDVAAIAEQLRLGRMDTLNVLAGLVRDGVIEPVASAGAPAPQPRQVEPEPMPPPAAETAPPPEPEPAPEPMREEASAPSAWETTSAAETEPAVQFEPEPTPAPAEEPRSERRPDLDAAIAERFSAFAEPEPRAAEPPPPASVPPAVDDRLASLTGIFAPGPAANAPAPKPAEPPPPQAADPWTAPSPAAPARPAESWSTAPPAASEAPANAWAPGAEAPAPETARPAAAAPAANEWSAPPPAPAPTDAEKKRGGLFGMFRREEPIPIARMPAAAAATSKPGMLASFSNALLLEYNSGQYGKGKIETRMANLLMRVDEQADPIDRPLPIVDDLIDATALERESFPEEQAVPYLATLVRQIYEDAERAYGKDKAKKGYKAAQQQVFRADQSLLQSPELAGKLPKV